MHWFRASLLSLGVFFLPLVASAQVPLFGKGWRIVPDVSQYPQCTGGALSFGAVLQTIQNLMNAAVAVTILIFIFVLVYAGILWMTSAASSENISKAKGVIWNAVVGMVIVLAAWLVVDFVMKTLYVGQDNIRGRFLPWNEVLTGGDLCIIEAQTKPLFDKLDFSAPDLGTISSVSGGGWSTGGQGGGGGSCTVPPDGPCSVAVLQQQCFGARAAEASKICNVESAGGNAAAKSGSDRLNGGNGPSYSVGLWQINLTVHKVAGLDCPSAFTMKCGTDKGSLVGSSKPGACYGAIIPAKQALYDQCVAAAQIHTNSTQVACNIYNQGGGFRPGWKYTANKCSVP